MAIFVDAISITRIYHILYLSFCRFQLQEKRQEKRYQDRQWIVNKEHEDENVKKRLVRK